MVTCEMMASGSNGNSTSSAILDVYCIYFTLQKQVVSNNFLGNVEYEVCCHFCSNPIVTLRDAVNVVAFPFGKGSWHQTSTFPTSHSTYSSVSHLSPLESYYCYPFPVVQIHRESQGNDFMFRAHFLRSATIIHPVDQRFSNLDQQPRSATFEQ